MSTPAQKANLARIRDNQRRSRARRREYIAELEARLRAYELEGVAASSEVQIAARRVAEENRQLRELLHKHGFQDEYISQFLLQQPGASSSADPVHALQQMIVPRRPLSLDSNVPFPLPSQVTRELASSSLTPSWDTPPVAMSSFAHPSVTPQQVVPPGPHSFTAPAFTEGPAPPQQPPPPPLRTVSYHQPLNPPGTMLEDVPQHGGTSQASENPASSMNYHMPMNPYHHNPTARDFPPPPPPGGYY